MTAFQGERGGHPDTKVPLFMDRFSTTVGRDALEKQPDAIVQVAYGNFVREPLRTFARDEVQRRNGLEVKDALISIGDAVLSRIQRYAADSPFVISSANPRVEPLTEHERSGCRVITSGFWCAIASERSLRTVLESTFTPGDGCGAHWPDCGGSFIPVGVGFAARGRQSPLPHKTLANCRRQ